MIIRLFLSKKDKNRLGRWNFGGKSIKKIIFNFDYKKCNFCPFFTFCTVLGVAVLLALKVFSRPTLGFL